MFKEESTIPVLENKIAFLKGDVILSQLNTSPKSTDDSSPFNPNHSALWIGDQRPIAHVIKSGRKLPGLHLTKLPKGKHILFRLTTDNQVAINAANIIRNWALSASFYDKKQYLSTYPESFWQERHAADLENFYGSSQASVPGPATPYLEPKATNEEAAFKGNPKILEMGEMGLRRAIKFASRRETISPESVSKGARCITVVIAAYQAAILAPIVKLSKKQELHFKVFKDRRFLEYAPDVLIEGWEKTEVGERLLESYKSNDYTHVFPKPFAVDSRYANINIFFEALKESEHFQAIGLMTFFEGKLEIKSLLDSPELSKNTHQSLSS